MRMVELVLSGASTLAQPVNSVATAVKARNWTFMVWGSTRPRHS